MTLCTKSSTAASRTQRRAGRPSAGKRLASREVSGRGRAECRRNLDSGENSNDSGLGYDNQNDPHHHTLLMAERLTWPNDRTDSKRLRMDIKLENEDANGMYCFPENLRENRDNSSLIRTAPTVSVPALSVTTSTSTTSSRTLARCNSTSNRQSPTSPVSLSTQLSSTSRYADVALTIIKQPEQQHRARYQTEGSRGAVKDRDGNGFPVVQLVGYYKPAMLQVYIGSDVGKVVPHMFYQACKVSGKNSTPCAEKKIDGTCVIELALDPSKEMSATCDCVGILKERNVDVEHRFPDQLGNRSKKKSTRCRMIFRTTITHENGTQETLQVGSHPIVCTQPPGIPEICKKSLTSCPASGGLELFVLGKNFLKDTKVYFQQFDDGHVSWEQAVVPDKEYLQQTHFVCVVPPYRRSNITEPVMVRLCVVSSGKTSESHQFVYTPINGAVPSVNLEAQHGNFLKSSVWTAPVRKREQDLDMMPPPESNMVPTSMRRPSISLTSSGDIHSPPLSSMKQEYIDENSQSSMVEAMEMHRERFRPVSESSLDVNHDSNMSLLNDNSIIMSESSNQSVLNEDSANAHPNSASVVKSSVELTAQESVRDGENASLVPPNTRSDQLISQSHTIQASPLLRTVEKVMDLRMKLPINDVNDYVSNASSIAALKSFGIEPTSAPLPTQSGQSVESYLTKIESKPSLLIENSMSLRKNGEDKITILPQTMTNILMQPTQSSSQLEYLNSHKPFLTDADHTISNVVKPNIATFPGEVHSGPSARQNTLISTLEGNIPTLIHSKIDEFVNSTLESHIANQEELNSLTTTSVVNNTHNTETTLSAQDIMLTAPVTLIAGPNINSKMPSSVLNQHEPSTPPALTTDVILNSDMSSAMITTTALQNSLISTSTLPPMCQSTATAVESELLTTAPEQTLMPPIAAQNQPMNIPLLASEPEKAVLLEAAVDFLKTQKKISEMNAPSPDMSIVSPKTLSPVMTAQLQDHMDTTFTQSFINPSASTANPNLVVPKALGLEQKSEFANLSAKELSAASHNEKKNEEGMITNSFAALTENELINLINPSCFDQGNTFH